MTRDQEPRARRETITLFPPRCQRALELKAEADRVAEVASHRTRELEQQLQRERWERDDADAHARHAPSAAAAVGERGRHRHVAQGRRLVVENERRGAVVRRLGGKRVMFSPLSRELRDLRVYSSQLRFHSYLGTRDHLSSSSQRVDTFFDTFHRSIRKLK